MSNVSSYHLYSVSYNGKFIFVVEQRHITLYTVIYSKISCKKTRLFVYYFFAFSIPKSLVIFRILKLDSASFIRTMFNSHLKIGK